jgi:2-polyprenyl-6-methoxyphenol hydroxylase-like FAD-dependent oxidoreductase
MVNAPGRAHDFDFRRAPIATESFNIDLESSSHFATAAAGDRLAFADGHSHSGTPQRIVAPMPNANDARDKIAPVLIVGGGPVGLALAGDLGWRGIRCTLIERTDGSIYQPRMDLVGIRTMEFCRRWGLVGAVEASPYPRDYAQDNIYLTSLAGYELGRERFPGIGQAPPPSQSPQRRERCPQNMFDPILRDFAAAQASVTMRYRTRLFSVSQDSEAVTAVIEDARSGAHEEIKARYIVGCDGGASLVRETFSIDMHGQPVLTYTTNVIFRCPHLLALHDKGKAYRHILIGPEGTWATIVAINGRDQWRFSLIGDRTQHRYTNAEIEAAIRRAVGRDFEFEILSAVPWVRRELVAETYRRGRAFIAGDAAHVMSPTGGFGMNTGIGDAVDLSWKLAAVIDGWGGDSLLDSYTAERQLVGARNVAEASDNLHRMLSVGAHPDIVDDTPQGAATRAKVGREFSETMRREWFTLGIHLGYRYEGSPICWPDGSPPPPDEARTYVPTARPGHRAPHAWLADGRSTLDLFGRGFTLLGFGAPADEAAALLDAARARRVPVEFVALAEPQVAELYQRRFVLVRPDGHVAWRDDRMPPDPMRVIDVVRGAAGGPGAAAWREQTRIV